MRRTTARTKMPRGRSGVVLYPVASPQWRATTRYARALLGEIGALEHHNKTLVEILTDGEHAIIPLKREVKRIADILEYVWLGTAQAQANKLKRKR